MKAFQQLIGLITLIFAVGLVLNYPLMLIINYTFSSAFLMAVFGVAKLTFWKTYALSFVITFLFREFKTDTK